MLMQSGWSVVGHEKTELFTWVDVSQVDAMRCDSVGVSYWRVRSNSKIGSIGWPFDVSSSCAAVVAVVVAHAVERSCGHLESSQSQHWHQRCHSESCGILLCQNPPRNNSLALINCVNHRCPCQILVDNVVLGEDSLHYWRAYEPTRIKTNLKLQWDALICSRWCRRGWRCRRSGGVISLAGLLCRCFEFVVLWDQ